MIEGYLAVLLNTRAQLQETTPRCIVHGGETVANKKTRWNYWISVESLAGTKIARGSQPCSGAFFSAHHELEPKTTPTTKMKRINQFNIGAIASLGISLASPLAFSATGEFGKMSVDEFKKANADAGMTVKEIKPDSEPLSEADKGLLKEIALGGMMQIELSRAATLLGSSADVKTIANAEIAEQSAIATKLNEMATAGGATMPDALESEATAMVNNLKRQTGAAADKMYLQASGIEGHEKLKTVMEKVQKEAKSPALKALAEAALPLINTHLQVAKDEASETD